MDLLTVLTVLTVRWKSPYVRIRIQDFPEVLLELLELLATSNAMSGNSEKGVC
jgi:hypothetical protein